MKGAAVLFLGALVALSASTSSRDSYGSGYISRFVCDDEFVIDETWHCDGSEDCPDGSDEVNCSLLCDIHEFRCHDKQLCIPRWRVCNGPRDCRDGSDEEQCITPSPPALLTCSDSQIPCANNQSCVWSSFLCDDDFDCSDQSDELNCRERNTTCSENQFECDEGMCVSNLHVCDGENDCYLDAIAADELSCESRGIVCGAGFFKCSSGECINIHNFCDGANSCRDGSDEENCPSLRCSHRDFSCLVGGIPTCIQKRWKCDVEVDCDNGEDEYQCGGTCPAGVFQCTSSTECITMDKKCDGVFDCKDSSDEYVCPFTPHRGYCEDQQLLCLDGLACLDVADLCNGHPNCMDGSDEDQFCRGNATSCVDNNGGCEHICHSHHGNFSTCSCLPGFQLNSTDLKSCHDYDECSHPDSCVQLCNNSQGSFSCSCASGYLLTADGNCKATGPKAHLVFANRVDIRSVGLDGNRRELLVKHLNYAADVDYHYELGYIYWVDLHSDKILRADLEDGHNITAIINSSLEGPSGVAVDWVNDKLYWTDGENRFVEVAELDGRHRKRLFSVNLDKPKAIVLDPLARMMFWTDWGSTPKIERASMDGGGREVIHSHHLIWPNALTLDLLSRTIYWADAKLHIIEASDYFGRNRRPIVTTGILHPFAITTFETRLYWSDWSSLSILTTTKTQDRRVTLLDNSTVLEEEQRNTSTIHENLHSPTGLRVVHPNLQPSYPGENPCERASSTELGCQFLCLLSSEREEGYACACPTGTELGANGTECNVVQNFLLYSRRGGINLVTVDDVEKSDIPLPVLDVKGPAGLDIDPVHKVLYWTDLFTDSISSLTLDGFRQQTLLTSELSSPDGIAVDWVGRKLYWTNVHPTRNGIEVSELDGSNRMVLITRGVVKPRDIVVHSTAGYVFWSDLSEDQPLIGRANLDGSERIVVADTGLSLPNGLALDYHGNKVYWCDARTHHIERANLDGSNRTLLITRVIHPYGLTIYGNTVYWTDWVQGSIDMANKMTGSNRRTFAQNLEAVIDLHAHSGAEQLEDVFHPCVVNNGGCSDLCLSRPSPSAPGLLQASCICPGGRAVKEDGRTCNEEVQQYLVFPTSKSVVQVSLDNDIFNPTHLPLGGFRNAYSADVDISRGHIYWTNQMEGRIFEAPLVGGSRQAVVTLDIDNPGAMAVDWVGQIMYWVDLGRDTLEVAALDGSNRKILISGGMNEVTSLVLDLQDRSLYWVSAGTTGVTYPQIEKSAMDGSGRSTLIANISGVPRSIAVHHIPGAVSGRIYWTDERNGLIESATLEGSDRRVVAVLNGSTSGAPYGIAVSNNHIYWTDTVDNAIYRISLTTPIQRTKREVGPSDIFLVINNTDAMGPLTVVTKSHLNNSVYDHPCSPAHNQPCSHLCLPDWSTAQYRCACPTGLELTTATTCRNIPSSFLLVAGHFSLMKFLTAGPDAGVTQTVAVPTAALGPVSVDHILTSPNSGRVFFSDQFRKVISSMNLDGTGFVDILHRVGLVPGLAVNWVDETIYWIDITRNRLEAARLDGSKRRVLYQYQRNNASLRGIALHPRIGVMFWTDWGTKPSIMRARMDGSIVSAVVDRDLAWPNAITIDCDTNTIYWLEAYYDRIESSDLNGRSRRVIFRNADSNSLMHGFYLLVKDNHLYWSDWLKNRVYKAPLPSVYNGAAHNLTVVGDTSPGRIFGFTVIDTMSPRRGELTGASSVSACGFNQGGCVSTHLCLPINQVQRVCACPDDSINCIDYSGFSGDPPPPSVLESLQTTPSESETTPTSTQGATTAAATTGLSSTSRGAANGATVGATEMEGPGTSNGHNGLAHTSSIESPGWINSSMSETIVVVVTLLVMIFVVMVSLAIIIIVTFIILKKQKKRNIYMTASAQRKQFRNPIYVSMTRDPNRRAPSHTSSSSSIPPTPSREEGFSLLPKLSNTKVIQEAKTLPEDNHLHSPQDRAKKTNSNIFVEEPDVFIMPGQNPHAVPQRGVTPEVIPFKPLLPLPQDDDDQPVKPLLPPPPIPPKTYIKLKFDGDAKELAPKKTNNSAVVVVTEERQGRVSPAPNARPKQSNLDCAKAVKFRSDVKLPVEPPPLPSRSEGKSNASHCTTVVGVARKSGMVTQPPSKKPINSNPGKSEVKCQQASYEDQDSDVGITIVTKDGTKVGEVVTNSSSDYDRLVPMKPPGISSDYDRLVPTGNLPPASCGHAQNTGSLHDESRC